LVLDQILVVFNLVGSNQNLVEFSRVGPDKNLAESIVAQIGSIRPSQPHMKLGGFG